jgi:glycosyltransferase involved in cell wall biosynthesis
VTRIGRLLWGNGIAKRVDLVLVQNDDGLQLPGRQLEVHPNVVVPVPPGNACETAIRRIDSFKVAVVVGRLLGWKGTRLALAALTYEEAQNWRLLILGDGPERNRLKRAGRKLGVNARVTWLGSRSRSESLAMISEADALLLPSLYEGAPFAMAEAVSAGTPVVALNHAGARAVVPGGRGILVDPGPNADKDIARALGALAGQALPDISHPDLTWLESRLPARVNAIYGQVLKSDGA